MYTVTPSSSSAATEGSAEFLSRLFAEHQSKTVATIESIMDRTMKMMKTQTPVTEHSSYFPRGRQGQHHRTTPYGNQQPPLTGGNATPQCGHAQDTFDLNTVCA